MAGKGSFRPAWREDVAKPGTYRTIFKYASDRFTHPPDAWVDMFRTEFGMADADFVTPGPGGDDVVAIGRRASTRATAPRWPRSWVPKTSPTTPTAA
jgi:hypothetical protein